MTPSLRLELTGISKQYPAVRANDRVDLRVKPGEIHAVLGENGAGKSTLMKIIYGAVQPDEGEIRWNGEPVSVASPAQARRAGHQHGLPALLAVRHAHRGRERLAGPGQEPDAARGGARASSRWRTPTGWTSTRSARCTRCRVGERQRVEIVRALLTDPQLLILDEPTSVLTPQAVDKLFVTLRLLAERGCSILYISHKLDEIRALCHHCTVLRGGKVTGEVDPTQESNASLSRLMIGAEPPQLQHTRARRPARVVLAGAGPEPAAAGPVRHRPRRTSPSTCAPARSSASPASRATASRS